MFRKSLALCLLLVLALVLSVAAAQEQNIQAQVEALAARYGATVVGTVPDGFDLQQAERALEEMARMKRQDENNHVIEERVTPLASGGVSGASGTRTVWVSCNRVHSYGPVSKKQIIVTAEASLHGPSNRFFSIESPVYSLSGASAIPFWIGISDVSRSRSWIDNNGRRANVEAYYVVTTNFAGVLENQWTSKCKGSKYA